jgi:hypothetical protein
VSDLQLLPHYGFNLTCRFFVILIELVVIGQADTDLGLFASSSEAHAFRETAYRYAENRDRVSAPTSTGGVQVSGMGEVSMSAEGVVKIRVGDGVAMKPKVSNRGNDSDSKAHFTKIRTRDTRLIRVTIVIRQHSRRLLNLVAVQTALRASEEVDPEWSSIGTGESQRGGGKVVIMDTMSLQEQVGSL